MIDDAKPASNNSDALAALIDNTPALDLSDTYRKLPPEARRALVPLALYGFTPKHEILRALLGADPETIGTLHQTQDEIDAMIELPATGDVRGMTAEGIDTTPPRWLWYPLIPRDALTLVVGQPATGKTALAVWLAAAITRGDALPNFSGHPTPVVRRQPARVAWYDAESTPGAFRRRLEAVGADLPLVTYFGPDVETTLDAVDTIRADLEGMPTPPALVVFDTLAGFLPDRCDLERMAQARRLLRPLAALAADFGAAVLLLHHEGKGARTNIMHVGVGSIGIMGAARSALFCGEHPETEGRYVMVHAKASEEARAGSAAYLLPRHELPNGAASVRLEFDGMADVDALAVVNGATHQSEADRGALAEAVEFLETYLSDGPAPKADVLKAARGEGISTSGALRRAVEALGIESKPHPQEGIPRNRWPWAWELPGAARVAQPPVGGALHNPAQPNDTRIDTDDSRVVQGCAKPLVEGKGKPEAATGDTPADTPEAEAVARICPTVGECQHGNTRRAVPPDGGDTLRRLCLDCHAWQIDTVWMVWNTGARAWGIPLDGDGGPFMLAPPCSGCGEGIVLETGPDGLCCACRLEPPRYPAGLQT